MKLHEAIVAEAAQNRNDQLKAHFAKALDQVIGRYPKDFDGAKADKARSRLLTRFDVNITKNQIESTLKALDIGEDGTITSREIAQAILTAVAKLDVGK